MSLQPSTNSRILSAYCERTPGSARLAQEAAGIFPSGITHDSRYMQPYGIFVERASGSRKWDVDANEYVDFFGGHGALLLGHGRAEVLEAACAAMERGTQFGANHPLEIEWGQQVQAMIPCAERVRFTTSGTEATLLALRLARAHTGRRRLLRLKTHFHGWHDHMTSGYSSHFDGSPTTGVLPGIAEEVLLIAPGDEEALREVFARHGREIAAAIVEPTGASFGRIPLAPSFLAALRRETQKAGSILIFDEVISGFRVSPGGAQAAVGITPDLTTLAKIVAGGLPGGAVVGRTDILERLDFETAKQKGFEKILHPGTFNANPVSAAAGVTALRIIQKESSCERANEIALELRDRLNHVIAASGAPWAVYGTYSSFQIFLNPARRTLDPLAFDTRQIPYNEFKANSPHLVHKLRAALLVNGVDIGGWPGGFTSSAHTQEDLRHAEKAFASSLAMLMEEGDTGSA